MEEALVPEPPPNPFLNQGGRSGNSNQRGGTEHSDQGGESGKSEAANETFAEISGAQRHAPPAQATQKPESPDKWQHKNPVLPRAVRKRLQAEPAASHFPSLPGPRAEQVDQETRWPELPEELPAPVGEWTEAIRALERAKRLELEQRGES